MDNPLCCTDDMLGSIGREPRKGMLYFSARYFPAPDENTWLTSEQQGQQNPERFSIMPKIGNPIFWQNRISLLTTPADIFCGAVMITAPSGFVLANSLMIVRCSSLVPGECQSPGHLAVPTEYP